MNPFEDPVTYTGDDVPEPQLSERPQPKRKRKAPKSPTEQLAEFEAKAASLRELLEQQRGKFRDELIEDLYKTCRIEPIKGDLNESERLRKLRNALNM